jgi:hypothetical protein
MIINFKVKWARTAITVLWAKKEKAEVLEIPVYRAMSVKKDQLATWASLAFD